MSNDPSPSQPPPLPQEKNLRAAVLLNLFLPGTGQLYLGRRVLGGVLAGAFLVCFVGMLGLFLIEYARYLNLAISGNILQGRRLEEIGKVFHRGWLLALLVAGLAIYLGALIHLFLPSKSSPPPPAKRMP
jgi:TM2 domain-containing membrane protein YozV